MGVIDILDRELTTVEIGVLEGPPEIRRQVHEELEARRLLAAAIAKLEADLLVFLGRHRLQEVELRRHHAHQPVDAAHQRHDTMGVLPLQIIEDVDQRVGDELHP